MRKPDQNNDQALTINPGNDLLSHNLAVVVPSAKKGLTSLFGMGRGVSPSLLSPEKTIYSVLTPLIPPLRGGQEGLLSM